MPHRRPRRSAFLALPARRLCRGKRSLRAILARRLSPAGALPVPGRAPLGFVRARRGAWTPRPALPTQRCWPRRRRRLPGRLPPGCSDLTFSLGDVLVRDDENLIACVDLLNLRSDGRGSFCLCRRLCLSGLRRGSLVLEIRMDLHRPDAETNRRQDRNTRDHHPQDWPLLAGRRRVGSTRLTIRRTRGRRHRISLPARQSTSASSRQRL